MNHRTSLFTLVTLAAALAACEQRSTTVQTPAGATTTTTVGITPEARAKMSQAVAEAASAANRLGVAASNLAATVEAKTPGALQSASSALSRAGDALADAAITAKVKSAFLADVDVKGFSIDVDTADGVVSLKGTLEQRTQADKAVAIARRIDGVKSVNSRIEVKGAG